MEKKGNGGLPPNQQKRKNDFPRHLQERQGKKEQISTRRRRKERGSRKEGIHEGSCQLRRKRWGEGGGGVDQCQSRDESMGQSF